MPTEIPKLWLDWAAIVAAFFAALLYLVPPETTNRSIPKLLARHGKFVSLVVALIFVAIMQTTSWLHTKIAVWIPFDIAALIIVMVLAIRSWRVSHTYSVPNYVESDGVLWEIKDNVVVHDPVCRKDKIRMPPSLSTPPSDDSWQCPECGKQYEWDKLTGSPQEAAAELVNRELRKRNMSADVIGRVRYYE